MGVGSRSCKMVGAPPQHAPMLDLDFLPIDSSILAGVLVHLMHLEIHSFNKRNLAVEGDEDITSTSTPAAPSLAPPDAPPPQAPPSGPITRARARELNFVMLLKNEGPEE